MDRKPWHRTTSCGEPVSCNIPTRLLPCLFGIVTFCCISADRLQFTMDLLSSKLIDHNQDRTIKESSKATFSQVDRNVMRYGKEAPKKNLIEIIKFSLEKLDMDKKTLKS